jgi:hypothetical protein
MKIFITFHSEKLNSGRNLLKLFKNLNLGPGNNKRDWKEIVKAEVDNRNMQSENEKL